MPPLQDTMLRLFHSLTPLLQSKTFLIPTCLVGTWKILSHINSHISQRSLNNYEPDSTWDWSKEVILITGGSNGIGAVMARKFAERDIKVIIWDIEAPSPELSKHASIHYYPVDVTNDALISTTATTVRSTHGAPTILINNAGIALAGAFLTEPPAYTHRQFAINILAQMRLVQEFVPDMAARNHGHVVSMASASSFISSTALVSYASSKAAVMAMHEGVAQELRTRYHAPRVRMSIVFPHFVRTGMVEKLTTLHDFRELLLEPEYVAEEVVKQVLSGRAGTLVLPPANAWLARLRAMPDWYRYYIAGLDPDVYKPRE